MKQAVSVYLVGLKNSFASRMAYRANFFFCALMVFISEMAIPFITLLIYKAGAFFPGWSLYEVLLLQGIFLLAKSIASLTYFGMVWNTLSLVREGTYDLLLIKPASTLLLSLSAGFEPDSMGGVFGGIIVIGFSLHGIPSPGIAGWLGFTAFFLLSMLVLFSFVLLMAGSVFKWVGNSRVYEIFDSVTSFGNYPRSIFSKSFQAIISYIIPVAAIGFFPAAALLGKSMDGVSAAILICLAFFILSLAFWKKMLSMYTSAGG